MVVLKFPYGQIIDKTENLSTYPANVSLITPRQKYKDLLCF